MQLCYNNAYFGDPFKNKTDYKVDMKRIQSKRCNKMTEKQRGVKTVALFICFALIFVLFFSGSYAVSPAFADDAAGVSVEEAVIGDKTTASEDAVMEETTAELPEDPSESVTDEEAAEDEMTETAHEEESSTDAQTEETSEESTSVEEESVEEESSLTEEETSEEQEEETTEDKDALLKGTLEKTTVETLAKANATSVSRRIGYVNAGGLNVRKGAGTNHAVIASISYVNVVILGEARDASNNLWYKIALGDSSGYIISGSGGVKYVTNIKNVSVDTTGLDAFPKEYREALINILAVYPNFSFSVDNIDYTLEEAVKGHVASKSYNWQPASYDVVYKYMDPLTYITSQGIFAFAKQYYNTTQTLKGLTDLVSTNNSFLNTDSYKKALMEAGKQTGVNPYVLAATILIEKGWHADQENPDVYGREVKTGKVTADGVYVRSGAGTNYGVIGSLNKSQVYVVSEKKDSKGKKWYQIIFNGHSGYISADYVSSVKYYNTYYNLFSVNQTDNDPVVGGIYYAMKEGWTTAEKSLIGGAKFYGKSYMNQGQDTYYYKDFNVIHPKSNWWHEYAGGITDVISSAIILSYAYANDHNAKLNFSIPVYKKSSSTTTNNTPKTGTTVSYKKGDVNKDGKIAATDYVAIKNHIMGTKKITDKNILQLADLNGDGKVSAVDYIAVKKIIMGR